MRKMNLSNISGFAVPKVVCIANYTNCFGCVLLPPTPICESNALKSARHNCTHLEIGKISVLYILNTKL